MAEARADDRNHGTKVAEPATADATPRAGPVLAKTDASAAGERRAAPHEAQRTAGGSPDAPELGRNPEAEEAALPPHEPGTMDIAQCEETYHRFIGIVIRAVITIFAVLMLLALING